MSKGISILLDNYNGQDTKEVFVTSKEEYKALLEKYLLQDPNNFASVRGTSSYTVEHLSDTLSCDLVNVFKTVNPINNSLMELDSALEYVWKEVI